ncbi:hypothetical protein [Alistipes shahii]|jgi:hypothetical protein|uniref:hypothetical protein n=1 Tax=Alistipes shahii TaxID=328814 RepID=UPI00266DB54F|nr:hypothetical protein [Alistipes shahii]
MTKENAIQLFEDKKVRSVWDSESGKWYISIVDVTLSEVMINGKRQDRCDPDARIVFNKE